MLLVVRLSGFKEIFESLGLGAKGLWFCRLGGLGKQATISNMGLSYLQQLRTDVPSPPSLEDALSLEMHRSVERFKVMDVAGKTTQTKLYCPIVPSSWNYG